MPARRAAGSRVLFLFLDGVGLAPEGPDNPLSSVPMPRLRSHLGGPLVLGGGRPGDGLLLAAVDACLGVAGVPQSATGQAALFTGINAPALVGEHVAAYPTRPLRALIAERSLLRRAAEAGARVLFANAHSERFWEMVRTGERSLSASTLAALAAAPPEDAAAPLAGAPALDRAALPARAPIPTLEDLLRGRAVLWDITHELANAHLGYALPPVSPEEAGSRLARLAGEHDLVLYETFLPDLAGHRRVAAAWVLARLDRFLAAVLDSLPADCTLVLSSDHGNLEDATTKLHTRNPVPLLAAGPQADRFRGVHDIAGIAPAILGVIRP